jgi:uncharacterized spore protein YtfJ
MTKTEIFNLIASIISISSAIFSFILFILNKTIRNELIKKRKIETYSTFVSKSTPIIEKIKKYSAQNKKSQSLVFDKLIEALRDYFELVNRIEKSLSKDGLESIKENIEKLKKFIKTYTGKGNNIYQTNMNEINETYFMVIDTQNNIKNVLDSKLYS